MSIDTNNFVIRDIPYLDSEKQLQLGAFVSKLVFIDSNRVKLEDHQMYFCGDHSAKLMEVKLEISEEGK